jgi:hypothetical protein
MDDGNPTEFVEGDGSDDHNTEGQPEQDLSRHEEERLDSMTTVQSRVQNAVEFLWRPEFPEGHDESVPGRRCINKSKGRMASRASLTISDAT